MEVMPKTGEKTDGSFYIRALNTSPSDGLPIRELYLYKLKPGLLIVISTAEDTDIRPYYRIED